MKKNIVITGVSSGIGRDALRLLHFKGYHIYGSVRKEADAKSLTEAYPKGFTPLIFDVQDQEAVTKAAKIVFDSCDRIDALINNAGIAVPGPLQFVSEEYFEKQMDVNLKSVRRITNTFLPLLGAAPDFKGAPGRIINISSISGLFNAPFNGVYSISKHALESMTDVYRRELRRYGIKVMAIEPGPIKTKIWGKNLNSMKPFADTNYNDILQKANQMIGLVYFHKVHFCKRILILFVTLGSSRHFLLLSVCEFFLTGKWITRFSKFNSYWCSHYF